MSSDASSDGSQGGDANLPKDIRDEMRHIRRALRKYSHRRSEFDAPRDHRRHDDDDVMGPPLPPPRDVGGNTMTSDVGKKWHRRIQESQEPPPPSKKQQQRKPSPPPRQRHVEAAVAVCVACEVHRVQQRNAKEKTDDLEKRLTESQAAAAEAKRRAEASARAERVKTGECDGKVRQMTATVENLRAEVERGALAVKEATRGMHEGVARERQLRAAAVEEARGQASKDGEALRQESAMERQQLRAEKDRLAVELKASTARCKSLEGTLAEVRGQKEANDKAAQETLLRAKSQLAAAGEEMVKLTAMGQATEAMKAREAKLSHAVRELLDGMEETLRRSAVHEEEYRRGNLELQQQCVGELASQGRRIKAFEEKARRHKAKAKEANDALALLRESAAAHEGRAGSLQQRLETATEQHKRSAAQAEDATRRALRAEEDLGTARRRNAQLERATVEVEGSLNSAKASLGTHEARVQDAERRATDAVQQMRHLQEAWEAERASLRHEAVVGAAKSKSPPRARPPPPPADADNSDDDGSEAPISMATQALLDRQLRHATALGASVEAAGGRVAPGGYTEQMASYKQRIQELVQEIHGDDREMAQFTDWAKAKRPAAAPTPRLDSSSDDDGRVAVHHQAPHHHHPQNDSRDSVAKKRSTSAGNSKGAARTRAR